MKGFGGSWGADCNSSIYLCTLHVVILLNGSCKLKLNTSFNQHKLFWRLIFPSGMIFALGAQLVATSCGLGLTFDSYLYLEGAEWFNGAIEGTMTRQAVFQSKPPLFPLFISWFSFDILPYVYTVLLLANLFIVAKIISASSSSFFWQAMAFLAIAMFAPLIMVHVYLWSEPVFLLLLYGSVLILIKSGKTGLSTRSLVILAALAMAMVMTRHVGLFVVIGIFLAMFFNPHIGWRSALVILLPAILVFLVWNFGLMSEGFSERLTTLKAPVAGGSWARLQNIEYYLGAASTWLLPHNLNKLLRIVLFIIVIKSILFLTRRNIKRSYIARTLLIVIASYYFMMHTSFLIDESSADRYLVPIYPLAIILIFHLLAQVSVQGHKLLKYLVVIWLLYPAGRTVKNTIFWKDKICNEAQNVTSVNIKDNYKLNRDR